MRGLWKKLRGDDDEARRERVRRERELAEQYGALRVFVFDDLSPQGS